MAEPTQIIVPRGRILHVALDSDNNNAELTLKALASATRLKILELLSSQVLNISEIGQVMQAVPRAKKSNSRLKLNPYLCDC